MVGSLLWEDGLRQHWRDRRLQLEKRQVVSAPIRYGRRSVTRADTFTIVIDPSTSSGDAILVLCIRSVETIGDLVEEAEALWRAERKVADGEGISAKWGCVGAFFSPDGLDNHVEMAWSSYFRSLGRVVVERPVVVGDLGGQVSGVKRGSNARTSRTEQTSYRGYAQGITTSASSSANDVSAVAQYPPTEL